VVSAALRVGGAAAVPEDVPLGLTAVLSGLVVVPPRWCAAAL
jgi:hypothetical protein